MPAAKPYAHSDVVDMTFFLMAAECDSAAAIVGTQLAMQRRMESRDELMSELALIERQLLAADEDTSQLVEELIETGRALKLRTDAPREDAHLFIEGTESVEHATWAQCGGLLCALAHDQVVDVRSFASRVARRIFELTPTHI